MFRLIGRHGEPTLVLCFPCAPVRSLFLCYVLCICFDRFFFLLRHLCHAQTTPVVNPVCPCTLTRFQHFSLPLIVAFSSHSCPHVMSHSSQSHFIHMSSLSLVYVCISVFACLLCVRTSHLLLSCELCYRAKKPLLLLATHRSCRRWS